MKSNIKGRNEDWELVLRSRTGDLDAYMALVERNLSQVYSLLSVLYADATVRPEMNSIVQALFVTSRQALTTNRRYDRFGSWISRRAIESLPVPASLRNLSSREFAALRLSFRGWDTLALADTIGCSASEFWAIHDRACRSIAQMLPESFQRRSTGHGRMYSTQLVPYLLGRLDTEQCAELDERLKVDPILEAEMVAWRDILPEIRAAVCCPMEPSSVPPDSADLIRAVRKELETLPHTSPPAPSVRSVASKTVLALTLAALCMYGFVSVQHDRRAAYSSAFYSIRNAPLVISYSDSPLDSPLNRRLAYRDLRGSRVKEVPVHRRWNVSM